MQGFSIRCRRSVFSVQSSRAHSGLTFCMADHRGLLSDSLSSSALLLVLSSRDSLSGICGCYGNKTQGRVLLTLCRPLMCSCSHPPASWSFRACFSICPSPSWTSEWSAPVLLWWPASHGVTEKPSHCADSPEWFISAVAYTLGTRVVITAEFTC